MNHRLIWMGVIVTILWGCSDSIYQSESDRNDDTVAEQPSNRDETRQSQSNPIIGKWKLISGQPGGEYWPEPCREIEFTSRASYCGDTGSPSSYDVEADQVTVYDDSFEQIYGFPEPDIMTTNVAGVGTLRFERIN